MKKAFPHWILIFIGFSLTITACNLTNALREPTPTPVPLAPVSVTPAQLARAMQDDQFFALYNSDLLTLTGKIISVNQTKGDLQIFLETGQPTAVVCDLGDQTASAQVGDTVTIQAAGADAERGQSAVMLRKCRLEP